MKLNFYQDHRTRTTFLLVIAPLIICLTLLLIFFDKYRAHQVTHQSLEKKLELMIKSLHPILATPLWSVDDKRVQQILDVLHNDPDLAGSIVFDDTFSRFGSSGILAGMRYDEVLNFAKLIDAQEFSFLSIFHHTWKTDNLNPLHQEFFIRKHDILFDTDAGTEKIGTMFFLLTSKNRIHKFSIEFGRDVLNILIITIILVVIIMVVYSRTTSVPLKKLHDIILAIQQGKEYDIVNWKNKGEVGRAIAAFNELQTQQLHSQKDLEETRDILERHVQELQERTTTLQEEVAARKLAERARRKSEIQFRSIFRDVPDAMVLANIEREIVLINPAFTDTFGYSLEEIQGKQTIVFYESREEFKRQGQERYNLSTEKRPKPYVVNYRRKNGDVFPGETVGTAIKNENGSTMFYLGVIRDITERKKIELLEQERKAAESANKAKSEFLANMSHELRTPMHGILSYADFGIHRSHKVPRGKLQDYFNEIADSGNRLMHLLNNLLDLAKLEAGKMSYTMIGQDMCVSIASAANEFQLILEEKSLHLKINHQATTQPSVFDAEKIGQVLRNLLSNSIKFSKSGSEIIIQAEKETVNVEGMLQEVIMVSVRDQGIGIPEPELATVFDKFIQSSKTKTGAGGTGLGLAICKQIVEDHGGRIWVENNLGSGSCFWFTIPMEVECFNSLHRHNA